MFKLGLAPGLPHPEYVFSGDVYGPHRASGLWFSQQPAFVPLSLCLSPTSIQSDLQGQNPYPLYLTQCYVCNTDKCFLDKYATFQIRFH